MGFNSTLVRFKPHRRRKNNFFSCVSIPLWFDSNEAQFHSTGVWVAVSIPLWFDSNRPLPLSTALTLNRFNSTLVRFKPEQSKVIEIQLNAFQFHSGSIQTGAANRVVEIIIKFQFHSGSIQTRTLGVMQASGASFQFHSGSIQTRA